MPKTGEKLGIGIYSIPDIERILKIPSRKIRYWLNRYWDSTLAKTYGGRYSWDTGGVRSVSFYTLIEFNVLQKFTEAGIQIKEVMKAHQELGKSFQTKYPFAHRKVLENIQIDGNNVYWEDDDGIMNLNGTKQLNFHFIRVFLKGLEFDGNDIASRYWPLGKDKSILIDPNRKFGQPVIQNNNISPRIINDHFKAGDPIDYLASIYDLSTSEISHAIEFCQAA